MTGIVAQLEERLLHTQEVIGSRPVDPISDESLREPASAGFSFCDVDCDVTASAWRVLFVSEMVWRAQCVPVLRCLALPLLPAVP